MKNDIESAIDTFIALKNAQPDEFSQALERILGAPDSALTQEENASFVAETLIKAPFEPQSIQALLELKSDLPKGKYGALAYYPRDSKDPFTRRRQAEVYLKPSKGFPLREDFKESLGFKSSLSEPRTESLILQAIGFHGFHSAWAHSLWQHCAAGFLPLDRQAITDMLWALETDDERDPEDRLFDDPSVFSETLHLFFSQPAAWNDLFAEVDFSPLSWISTHWLYEGDEQCEKRAIETLSLILKQGLKPRFGSPWMPFLSLRHSANLPLLPPLFKLLADGGHIPLLRHFESHLYEDELYDAPESMALDLNELASTSILPSPPSFPKSLLEDSSKPMASHALLPFCKQALVSCSFSIATELLIEAEPQALRALDDQGRSPLYWINARLSDSKGSHWSQPLVDAFRIMLRYGANPQWIAPQINPKHIANHDVILAALDRWELDQSTPHAPSHSLTLNASNALQKSGHRTSDHDQGCTQGDTQGDTQGCTQKRSFNDSSSEDASRVMGGQGCKQNVQGSDHSRQSGRL